MERIEPVQPSSPEPERDERALAGCRHLVAVCARLRSDERALVITDERTAGLGEMLAAVAASTTTATTHRTIPGARIHGQEPPGDVAAEMLRSDVIFCLTSMSLAHTQARFEASNAGARFLSLPDYSLEVLRSDALLADYEALTPLADALAAALTAGSSLHITTALGTDLRCRIEGRRANSTPGWCRGPGSLASPPDSESHVATIEDGSDGRIVVDGSVPCRELGRLDEPITLMVAAGKVLQIEGGRAETLRGVFDAAGDERARIVAEFGVGLNPLAKLCGSMLIDEGCLGTVHFGIGANATIGGTNRVPFHLDHVVQAPTVSVDGTVIIREGRILDEVLL